MSAGAFGLAGHVHRRHNPLNGEWVLVSPHRTQRPWQGQVEGTAAPPGLAYDPECYLCPGNARAGGVRNPAYGGTFVFDNDFAALRPDTPAGGLDDGLLQARAEQGLCRVLCFSPRHDLALAQLPLAQRLGVVEAWAAQSSELGALPGIRAVTLFENRGALMGASNAHPHGQAWANAEVPHLLATEVAHQGQYLAREGHCLLCRYLEQELRVGERIVCQNEGFVALVPFWATWPFETLLLPRVHAADLPSLAAAARGSLAAILGSLCGAYDRLFGVPFPYTMGWHQQPCDGAPYPGFHLHAHCYPPLLRSATVRKFMVGYEMLAGPQRDITPESAAERLRALVT